MDSDTFKKPSTDFTTVHLGGGYSSAFESDSEAEGPVSSTSTAQNVKKDPLFKAYAKQPVSKATNEVFREEAAKEAGQARRFHFLSLDAYSRHKKLVNHYLLYRPGATDLLKRDTSRDKTDYDILRQHHQFLWEEEDDVDTWEKRLAKKYYDRLFKEYSICNLSRYKENKVALRWRVEQEVIEGKGQFICGNKQCQETEGLRSWEVNFGYMEHGEKKNALVKLRLCPPCSDKLNYRHRRKEIKLKKKRSRPSQEVSQETPQKKQRTENEEEEASSTEPEAPSQVWSKPIPQSDEDKPQEEEFEDYLADMFL